MKRACLYKTSKFMIKWTCEFHTYLSGWAYYPNLFMAFTSVLPMDSK
ncbi:MAG: hypothetical protein WC186_08765 [Bacteroidales bacterium]